MKIRFIYIFVILITEILKISQGFASEKDKILFSKKYVFKNGNLELQTSANLQHPIKIGLVLSGGGARGLSHIGVLRVLEENGIKPDFIVGTSIGSVVGGLYAAGYSVDEIEAITKNIDWTDIFSDTPERSNLFLGQKNEQDRYLVSMRFTDSFGLYIPNAVSPGQKVLNILSDLFLKARYQVKSSFDDLKISFRTVATDIVSGKMIILDKGNIAECINGSLAVPLLFSPVLHDSMLLVDGGIKANLPASVARDAGVDVVISVDVSSKLRERDQINAPWEIADQVTTIMSGNNSKKDYEDTDVLIRPDVNNTTNTDFRKVDSLIAAGAKATREEIPKIKEILQKKNVLQNRYLKIDKIDFRNAMFVDLAISRKSINDSLIALGFLTTKMTQWMQEGIYKSIDAEYDSLRKQLKISFNLFGRVDSIAITGATRIPEPQLLDSMRTQIGTALNATILKNDLDRIVDIYRRAGYSLMEITRLGFDEKTGLLSINIDEGSVGEITVSGNNKTKDYIILREFVINENDVFNWERIKESLNNVYASQYFSRVSVDVQRKGQRANLVVRVEEKPSIRFQMGGKADIERRFQGYLELADENFLGRGIKQKIVARLGVRDGLLGVSTRMDRIFTTFLTFMAQGYYSWQVNSINLIGGNSGRYREERLGIRLQLGQQIQRIGQLVAELRIEHVKDMRQDGVFEFSQKPEIRTFSLRSVTDKRDRIDFPTKGIYNYWSWENGNTFLLNSQESYTKVMLNLEGYYTYFHNHTLHLRFLGGLGDESLPFSESFRIGGLHSVYGLLENELYGRQVVLANIEYRFLLPFKLLTNTYISARYDFGSVWNKPNLLIKSDDFFSAFGGYVGFDTFLGPLYVGWGKMSLGRQTFYLSLGFDY